MKARANRYISGSRALRLVAVLLCTLPLLAACGATSSEKSNPPAVTALPTLTPFPSAAARPPDGPAASPPVRAERLTLFIQPDDGRAPVLDLLNNAQTSIDLMIYLLSDRDVIAALKNAVLRGVAVRVLLEQNPCCSTDNAMQRALFSDCRGRACRCSGRTPPSALPTPKWRSWTARPH